MARMATVMIHHTVAGTLSEDEHGYNFLYHAAYLQSAQAEAVSLTLPLQKTILNKLELKLFLL